MKRAFAIQLDWDEYPIIDQFKGNLSWCNIRRRRGGWRQGYVNSYKAQRDQERRFQKGHRHGLSTARPSSGYCKSQNLAADIPGRVHEDGMPARNAGYDRDPVASASQPVSPAKHDYTLYQFFAPGGLLSRTHPAYEFRRGQLQMAQAVEEALVEKRHLIVEAGTGTGKTL